MGLNITTADLDSVVTVRLERLHLKDRARRGVNDGHRMQDTRLVEHLRHADFLA